MFAAEIRRRRIQLHRCYSQWGWHLDEVFVRFNGETHYLWRTVDHECEVREVFATKRRDCIAALRFLCCRCLYSILSLVGTGFIASFYEIFKRRPIQYIELATLSTNEPAWVKLVQSIGDELSGRPNRTRKLSERR